jgi:hypothetical protein
VSLIRFLVFGALTLFVLLPVAGILTIIGLPLIAVLGAVAVPVLILLFLVGLPVAVVLGVAVVGIGIIFALLGAMVGLGLAALKLALFVALPVWIVFWLIGKMRRREASW